MRRKSISTTFVRSRQRQKRVAEPEFCDSLCVRVMVCLKRKKRVFIYSFQEMCFPGINPLNQRAVCFQSEKYIETFLFLSCVNFLRAKRLALTYLMAIKQISDVRSGHSLSMFMAHGMFSETQRLIDVTTNLRDTSIRHRVARSTQI